MVAGKKSVLKLTRDKKGNITKSNNTSYTYAKGKLDKVGSMKWNGNYIVDKKKDNGAVDPGHEVWYDRNGRPWHADWKESNAEYAYDTKDRFVLRAWEGNGMKDIKATRITAENASGYGSDQWVCSWRKPFLTVMMPVTFNIL